MNNLVKQLHSAHQKGYEQGVVDGKEFALSLVTIALNDLYGYGGDRIASIEKHMQELWDKEFAEDPESGARHLVKRLNQIRGVECGQKKEDV